MFNVILVIFVFICYLFLESYNDRLIRKRVVSEKAVKYVLDKIAKQIRELKN